MTQLFIFGVYGSFMRIMFPFNDWDQKNNSLNFQYFDSILGLSE